MLTQFERREIQTFFEHNIEGGVASFNLDYLIEDNVVSRNRFEECKTEIEDIFHNSFFVCEVCSWDLPISSLSHHTHRDSVCEDCV